MPTTAVNRTAGLRRALLGTALTALLATGLVAPVPPAAEAAPLPMSALLPASADKAPTSTAPVPSGALFVATNGSDSNPGTAAAPFRTLGHAFTKLKAGGAIVLRGGVYREGATGYATGGTSYQSRLSNVVIQAYPGETVWLDGTEVVSSWSRVSGSHFSTPWSTPGFCAGQYYTRHYSDQTSSGPCSYPDAIGGRSALGDPQMLYRDGVALKQVASVGELTADTFFYDHGARVMHIGFDPSGRTVEVTKHAQGLALFQPTNVSIKGIGFRRYATSQFANATQGAVLLNAGSNVVLEKVTIAGNAGTGLLSWNTNRLTIRQSVISANGANGFNMAGSHTKLATDPSLRDDLLIEHTRVERNNANSFNVDCVRSCNSSGVKLAGVIGATVRYSTFNYNGGLRASGLWFDLSCSGAKVYANKMIGNARHGLVYEVSDDAVIASNLISVNGWGVDTHGGGYGMMIGSPNVRIWNNTVVNNKMGVFLYDDPRSPLSSVGMDASRVGPNSVNIDFANNIVATNTKSSSMLLFVSGGSSAVAGNTSGDQSVRLLDHNSYATPVLSRFAYWRSWTEQSIKPYNSVAALRAATGSQREANGVLVEATVNPFLVDPDRGDYSLKAGSQAAGTGRPLPSEVASLLGVPAGVAVDRGTLTLGG